DLRVDELGGPVKLYYKAHVYQNSGVAWDKVKLSLSTGNPNEGAEAPVLSPWYLQFYMPRPKEYRNKSVSSDEIEKMPTRNTSSMASTTAGVYQETTMEEYVQTDNSGINTVFDIDLPYTIPSDGQQHNVAIKSAELP